MLLKWNIWWREMSGDCFRRNRAECLMSWGREAAPDAGTKVWESASKIFGFCSSSVVLWACMCLVKSGESRKDGQGVEVQKDKRIRQNLWLRLTHASSFAFDLVNEVQKDKRRQNLRLRLTRASSFGFDLVNEVAVAEVCSVDVVVLWEQGV